MKDKVIKDTLKLLIITFILNIPLFLLFFVIHLMDGPYIPYNSTLMDGVSLGYIAFYIFAYIYIIAAFFICRGKVLYVKESLWWYFLFLAIGSLICSIINKFVHGWTPYMLFNITVVVDKFNSFTCCFMFMMIENILKTSILFFRYKG